MDAIQRGTLRIHLLGVVTDLACLRSEFSFVIVLDDPVQGAKLQDLSYEVRLENGTTRQAKWLRGSHEGKRLMPKPVTTIGEFVRNKVWNPPSMAMLALLAELTQDRESWFIRAYPSFPSIELPL